MSTFLKEFGENAPKDERNADPSPTLLNPDEAANYLGVASNALSGVLKQYGVGRYHLNRTHDQIVYRLDDLQHVRDAMRTVKNAAA